MAQGGGNGGDEFNTTDAPLQSCYDKKADKQPVLEAPNSLARVVALPGKRGGNGVAIREVKTGSSGEQQSEHEQMHIWTERERRKKMRDMFTNLHALLPQLPAKADKSSIVDEAVSYIKTLEYTIHQLEKQKPDGERIIVDSSGLQTPTSETSREAFLADHTMISSMAVAEVSPVAISGIETPMCFRTWSSPNVVLSVAGSNGHISICGTKTPGGLSSIFQVLEEHKLEIVTAQYSSDNFRFICMIHLNVNGGFDQFLNTLAVEELYKSAAGDIIQQVSP